MQLGVLVGLEAQVGPGLLQVGRPAGVRDGVEARLGHGQRLPSRDRDPTGEARVVEHECDIGGEARALGVLVEVRQQERRDVLAVDVGGGESREGIGEDAVVEARGISSAAGIGLATTRACVSPRPRRARITAAMSAASSSRHGTGWPESRM